MNSRTIPRDDIPEHLSPLLVKEIRQSLRTRAFTLSFAGYHVLMLAILLTYGSFDGNSKDSAILLFAAAFPMIFIPAVRAGDALNSEIRGKTMEMLYLSRLDAWRIVWGKWVGSIVMIFLFFSSSLPYVVARYFISRGNFLNDLMVMTALAAAASVLSAMTLCISSALPKIPFASAFRGFLGLGCAIGGTIGLFSIASVLLFEERIFGTSDALMPVLAVALQAPAVVFLMLSLSASGIAPESENHARSRRLCILASLILGCLAFSFNDKPVQFFITFLIWLTVFVVDAFAPEGHNPTAFRALWKGRCSASQRLFLAPNSQSAAIFHLSLGAILVWLMAFVEIYLKGGSVSGLTHLEVFGLFAFPVIALISIGEFAGRLSNFKIVAMMLLATLFAGLFSWSQMPRESMLKEALFFAIMIPALIAPLGLLRLLCKPSQLLPLYVAFQGLHMLTASVVESMQDQHRTGPIWWVPFHSAMHVNDGHRYGDLNSIPQAHVFYAFLTWLIMIPFFIYLYQSGGRHRQRLEEARVLERGQ